MTSQPWIRHGHTSEVISGAYQLQWSHDLSAMDTGSSWNPSAMTSSYGRRIGNLLAALQWSHDLSAMDTSTTSTACDERVCMLQWSHDLSAMDTRMSSEQQSGAISPLQWSHDLSAMDTRSTYPSPGAGRQPCFNGAMTSQPWIRGQFDWDVGEGNALQWSHDLSAMDTRYLEGHTVITQALQWSHDLSAMDTAEIQDFPPK